MEPMDNSNESNDKDYWNLRLLSKNKKALDTQLIIPTTRYHGSKAKIAKWIWGHLKDLKFKSFLDAFGGTGVVGYVAKCNYKTVYYNDILKFNFIIGKALIENNFTKLSEKKFKLLLKPKENFKYKSIIADNFKDIFYTDEENKWLDIVVQNIQQMKDPYEQAIAYYAIFQACMIKRPFSLFHRKNLYIRTANVKRSFGNKTTWDIPFEVHALNFLKEINSLIINNQKQNYAFNSDVFQLPRNIDLVYLDPPYTSKKGVSVDYRNFYHFLEGIMIYDQWEKFIDHRVKNKRLIPIKNPWNDKNQIAEQFKKVINYFKDSIIAISYRNDGIPNIDTIVDYMSQYKSCVDVFYFKNYKYALSNGKTQEVLIVGK
ncbi:MAG: DNA adenine methylase [Promethearchaeota archaeon]